MDDARQKVWLGVDPGGVGRFGVAILNADGTCFTCAVDHVDAAVDVVCEHIQIMPAGLGVDAPLWWSSGPGGLRQADKWIRDQYDLHHRNVQAVNSLWGSVLAQGMMLIVRLRERLPGLGVTETHPKAVLVAQGREHWASQFREIPTKLTLDDEPDHERDALISAIAAREGFEGRWKRDLINSRYPSEQDPSAYWLAPVHYFWPS